MLKNTAENVVEKGKKSQIGLIGLAVMGANLARNFASRGLKVSVFNRTYQKTEELLSLMEKITANSDPSKSVDKLEEEGKLVGFENLAEFMESLERPRKIILMVKSGPPVDDFLALLQPYLDPEDVVLDCGNSNWKDTLRRQEALLQQRTQNSGASFNHKSANNSEPLRSLNSKTAHLIGLFSDSEKYSRLANWAKMIQKAGENGAETIALHLIADGIDTGKNIFQIWTEFVEKYGEALKPFEKKIFLGSLGGRELGMSNEAAGVCQSLYPILDYHVTDKNGLTLDKSLPKFFASRYSVDIDKIHRELSEKFDVNDSLPNGNPGPESFSYSSHEQLFFLNKDRLEREKLGPLKFEIAQGIEYYQWIWEKKGIGDSQLPPASWSYLPLDAKTLPKSRVNKNDTIYLVNHTSQDFEKFTEVLLDLNQEYELNLEIFSNFPSRFAKIKYLPIEENQNQNLNETFISKSASFQASHSFHFLGCGVSGGEEGALYGPSIMPGGEKAVVDQVLPLLQKIAAKDFNGHPCVTNVGLGPAGHFVKMVHNGIEYAMMQGIAEIYDILRYNSYSNEQIHDVFVQLNQGELKSFLLDITVKIFESKDALDSGFLIDKIVDEAGAKGTGAWTVEAGMELGIAVPTIAAAVFARTMSARNHKFDVYQKNIETRVRPKYWQNVFELKDTPDGLKYRERDFELVQEEIVLENTLFYQLLLHIYKISYLQGLELIIEANQVYKWNMDISEVLRIWQGGCIIRSNMLENLIEMYRNDNDESFNLREFIGKQDDKLGDNILPHNGLPLPVIHSVFDYILSITNKNLPTNLIQAQRDFFGAHTYKRNDREGIFTGGWVK